MSMFDGILSNLGNLGNLQEVADKLGLPADKMQALMTEISAKIGSGETSVAALADTAAEHGVSADGLQELLAQFGGPEAILGRIGAMFDKDGDGNPLNELSGLAKGLFG